MRSILSPPIWGLNEPLRLVDPRQIILQGHDYGFFPGCCGIMDDTVVVCGSLKYLKEGRELKKYIRMNNMKVIELYDGELVDVGSVFFI